MEADKFQHSEQSLLERFQKNKSNRLKELRKENQFCDLTFKSEDGLEIRVHKNVVASASNYFNDLLTTPMKEKYEEYITLPDITADILEKIITFIYTNEFKEKIEDVEKIIKYAALFQLEELIEICSLILKKSISDLTCVNYWQLAKVNLIYDLEDNCLAYIVNRADYLFENSLLNNVSIEEMKTLLAQDSLHSKHPEQMIFEYVLTWTADQVTDTKKFSEMFSEIVDLFKFSKLKDEYIFMRIFGNDDLLDNAELLKKIAKLTNVKHKLMLQKKVKIETPTRFIFRKKKLLGLASNQMFTGLERDHMTLQIEKILPKNFGYTTVDSNFLVICGGVQRSSCEYLDANTQELKEFPSMKKEKSSHACMYLDNKIYACGGAESKSVEIFDVGKGEWYNGPDMISKGVDFGLTAVDGALYAIKKNNCVEMFDPRTKEWSNVSQQNHTHYYSHHQYQHDRKEHSYKQCIANSPYIYCFNKGIRHKFDTRSKQMVEKISYMDFDGVFSVCELDSCFIGFGYKYQFSNGYELKFVQNQH